VSLTGTVVGIEQPSPYSSSHAGGDYDAIGND
jgi:hypothetical protein